MARILDSLVGHVAQVDQVLKAYRDNRLPSTFLFVGPSGIGKQKAALGLAQALMCEASKSACGVCASCLRVAKGNSESVLRISPSGTQIKVEQGREILEFLSLQRLQKARVVVIDQAHLLNVQAGNALLKTLEEPPESTYIFMITHSQAAVLPTIRSRAQSIRFSPLSAQDLKSILGKAPDWVLASSQGRVDLAYTLEDESWAEVREQALRALLRVLAGQPVDPEALKEAVKDKNTALFTFTIWQKFLRDVCVAQVGRHSFVNVDRAKQIEECASKVNSHAVLRLLELSLELEGPVLGNVDRNLVVENFFFKMRKLAKMNEDEVIFYGMD